MDEVFPQKAPTGRLHCSPGRQPAAGWPALGGRRSRTPSFFFSPEPRKGRLNLNRPDGAQSKKGKWWLGRIPRACARGYITVRPSEAQKKGGWHAFDGESMADRAFRQKRGHFTFSPYARPGPQGLGSFCNLHSAFYNLQLPPPLPPFYRPPFTPHSELRTPHWPPPPPLPCRLRNLRNLRNLRKSVPRSFKPARPAVVFAVSSLSFDWSLGPWSLVILPFPGRSFK